jgi:tripeptide aminopeptidase
MISHASTQSLLLELLALPGPSGGEEQVAEFITRHLRQAGAPAESISADRAYLRSPFGGRQGNLICRLPGTVRGPRLLLMAHMDTVPLCAGASPRVRGNWVTPADPQTALGADDRSGTAVVLATALEILRQSLAHPPLTLLWTVQEEVGLCGARYLELARLGKPRLAVNFDGGPAEKVTIGATGGYRLEIAVHGLAAHAGVAPDAGVSAIAIASLAIAALHHEGWHGKIQKGGRQGTSNVGVIRGGEATNVVTPRVDLRAEARSHDPAFRGRIVRQIQRAFAKAARTVRNRHGVAGTVEISDRLDYEAFLLGKDDASVRAAEEAIRAVGGEPFRAVSNGGLDANWMTARGIPTVTLGCGQSDPHTTAERLDLAQFRLACEMALRLATRS